MNSLTDSETFLLFYLHDSDAKYVKALMNAQVHFVLISETNRINSTIEDFQIYSNAYFVLDRLSPPLLAAKKIAKLLKENSIQITQILNTYDEVSSVYYFLNQLLGISEAQYVPYINSRLKPTTRSLSNQILDRNRIYAIVDRNELSCAVCTGSSFSIKTPSSTFSIEYPFVFKHLFGYASLDTKLIRNEHEANRFIEQADKKSNDSSGTIIQAYTPFDSIMIEDFIDGVVIGIDGAYCRGKLALITAAEEFHYDPGTGFSEIGGIVHPFCNFSSSDIRLEIHRFICELLQGLGFQSCIFHVEIMLNPDGQFELLEVNPRIAGGGIDRVIAEMFGIDMPDALVRLYLTPSDTAFVERICRQSQSHTMNNKVFVIAYSRQSGRVRYIRNTSEFDVSIEGRLRRCSWHPLMQMNEPVRNVMMEQYVGTLEFSDYESVDVLDFVRTCQSWLASRTPHLFDIS